MSSADGGRISNKQNLSKLRQQNYFDHKITKYKVEKNAVNLKQPSDEVIAANRVEVQKFVKRKRIATVVFIVSVLLTTVWIVYSLY